MHTAPWRGYKVLQHYWSAGLCTIASMTKGWMLFFFQTLDVWGERVILWVHMTCTASGELVCLCLTLDWAQPILLLCYVNWFTSADAVWSLSDTYKLLFFSSQYIFLSRATTFYKKSQSDHRNGLAASLLWHDSLRSVAIALARCNGIFIRFCHRFEGICASSRGVIKKQLPGLSCMSPGIVAWFPSKILPM